MVHVTVLVEQGIKLCWFESKPAGEIDPTLIFCERFQIGVTI